MDQLEAIKTIKAAKRNIELSGTQNELDSFVNGIEYCLSLLEGRAPEYRKREINMECEFYIKLYENTGATVEIDNGRVTAINPPRAEEETCVLQ